MNAVEIQQVTKTFGRHVAVEDLTVEVPSGSVYGFIGPNGSGKTTTLRMIMRILHPDHGTIRVLGEDTLGAASDRVGYLPEERGLYKQMKVRELLRFYAELKGLRHSRDAIDFWLQRLDLTAWADKRVQALSKGMAQKVQFIATVVSRPELVLLDEPFSGLDPINSDVLRDAVLELKAGGATVIFSTHDMNVAELMCDFIFMIYRGRKVLDGTLPSIRQSYGQDTARVCLEGNGRPLGDLPGVLKVTDFGRWQELRLAHGTDTQDLLAGLMARGRVSHFELAHPTLRDIFVRIADPEKEENPFPGRPAERSTPMRKMRIIAVREYLAAVRTKTFVIGLLLMPILSTGSGLVQWLLRDMVDIRDKHFALVDRSPDQKFVATVKAAVEKYDEALIYDPKTKQQVKPRFLLNIVPPASNVLTQRYDLSQQVRDSQLSGFLEIRDLSRVPTSSPQAPVGPLPPVEVRYQTNRPADDDFLKFIKAVIDKKIRDDISRQTHLGRVELDDLLQPVKLESKGLTSRDPRTGALREASEQSRIASLVTPAALMILMFMVILMSATPLMQGVVEEKMQRIAEVLLGSVGPFELMMGKLLGMVGVSLTISAVYLGGAYWVASRFGFDEFLTVDVLAWFILFQCLAALMYGSLFIAIGAACTDMKETQNLLWPVMLLAMLPLFLVGSVMREPNSPVATGLSFFPFSTPMLMIARQAVPPGLPWWQPVAGILLVLATTLLCVYIAGRIFRVGMLLQGKGARMGELARWVFRG